MPIDKDFANGRSLPTQRKRANAIDNAKINIFAKGEKQCRKISRESNLPFSSEIQRIYRLKIAYVNLKRWAEGRVTIVTLLKQHGKQG
jgi:hypothetical protein